MIKNIKSRVTEFRQSLLCIRSAVYTIKYIKKPHNLHLILFPINTFEKIVSQIGLWRTELELMARYSIEENVFCGKWNSTKPVIANGTSYKKNNYWLYSRSRLIVRKGNTSFPYYINYLQYFLDSINKTACKSKR